jgi:hypothetical protein
MPKALSSESERAMNLSTPNTVPAQKPFVTKEALAQRYGVCDRTIEKWMKAGILVFLKVRRVVRFHVQGCDEALRKRGFLTGALVPSQDP